MSLVTYGWSDSSEAFIVREFEQLRHPEVWMATIGQLEGLNDYCVGSIRGLLVWLQDCMDAPDPCIIL